MIILMIIFKLFKFIKLYFYLFLQIHFTDKKLPNLAHELMTETKHMFIDILIQIDYIKSLEIIKKGFQQLLVTIYACTKLLLQEMK